MDVTVLIPAYEPDERLVGYADRLAAAGFGRIVVVDDGSDVSCTPVFDELRARPFCTVLAHEVNRGKGAALRTGFAYILERFPETGHVLTADADGQHSVEDCVRVAAAAEEGADAVCLGSRNFSLGSVPFRSWIGNRWSSATFALVHGRWLPDTQTGLRTFPSALLPMLLSVGGDRYEYEMGVLMALARGRVPVKVLPIRTIYEDGNASSHFDPLRDTIRINRLVLGEFFRFAGVSVSSFLLDQGLAWLFAFALETAGVAAAGVIWASGFAARLVSSVFNFALNRSFVFRSRSGVWMHALKYFLLCLLVIVASNIGVTALSYAGMPRGAAKFICDTLLYFAGYLVQAKYVFGDRARGVRIPPSTSS